MASKGKRPDKAKPGRKKKAASAQEIITKTAEPRKTGRPCSYTPELGKAICDLVAERVAVVDICARVGMPSRDTLYRWKRDILEFSDNYARAREHRAHSRADFIDEITRKLMAGSIDPQSARVIIDAEKWQMAKEQPRIYGERVTNEHVGKDGGPIETRDFDPDRKLNIARRLAVFLSDLDGSLPA